MPYLNCEDGGKVYYTDQGKGNTIVLIHGLLVNSLFWERNVPDLVSSGNRVITIDMRGHGFSLKDYSGNTPTRVAKDVKLLLETLDINGATLVGWSTGGYAVHSYVSQFGKERISGVSLVEMPPKFVCSENWEYGLFGGVTVEAGVKTIRDIFENDFGIRSAFVPLCFAAGSDHTAEKLSFSTGNTHLKEHIDNKFYKNLSISQSDHDFFLSNFMLCTTNCFISFWSENIGTDYLELIPKYPVPALIICGSKSQLFPKPAGKWTLENLPKYPQNKLVMFENSGHSPQFEEPEKFNKELNSFVKSLK